MKHYGRTFKIGILFFAVWALILFLGEKAMAELYHCTPTSVVDSGGLWSKERMEQYNGSLMIKHQGKNNFHQGTLKRCSFAPSIGKVTCDSYPIDYYKETALPLTSSWIDKLYYYRGQMDVQMFIKAAKKESKYIENNGRGTIYRGICIEQWPE